MNEAEDAFQRLIDFEIEARRKGGWCFVGSLIDAREYIVGKNLPNIGAVMKVVDAIRRKTGLEVDQPLTDENLIPVAGLLGEAFGLSLKKVFASKGDRVLQGGYLGVEKIPLEENQPTVFPVPSVMCFIRKADNEGHTAFIRDNKRGQREFSNLINNGYTLNAVLQYVRK